MINLKNAKIIATLLLSSVLLANCDPESESEDPKFEEILPESVSLSKSEVTLQTGSTERINAQVNPSNASNQQIIWASSDPTIATVSFDGKIEALKVGEANISATTFNGKTSACKVIVIPIPVSIVFLDKSEATIEVGDTFQLNPIILPENAANKNVLWESSDNQIVSVSEYGIVTGLQIGDATLKVKTVDGNFTATCNVKVRQLLKVIVTDNLNKTLQQATVIAFDPQTKTYVSGISNESGVCVLASPIKKSVTILVAHKNYKAEIVLNQNNNDNLTIKMTDGSYGSIAAPDGSCEIPGLSGRLNPIKDNLDRLYIYAQNISINNGAAQPVTFDMTNSLRLEDALGVVKNIWIPFIDGQTSIINYQPK